MSLGGTKTMAITALRLRQGIERAVRRIGPAQEQLAKTAVWPGDRCAANSLEVWLNAAGAKPGTHGWYQDLYTRGDTAVPGVLADMRRVVTAGFRDAEAKPYAYYTPDASWLRNALKLIGHNHSIWPFN
jgi:hypothetical protein